MIFYSNCLFYVLRKYFKYGGYLIVRKSRDGWFPHFIWCRDLKDAEIEHFQPMYEDEFIPVKKFWFKGFVSKSDDEERIRMGE